MTLKSLVTLIPGVFVYVQVYSSYSGIHISKNVSANCLTDCKIFQILIYIRPSIDDVLSECIFTNLVSVLLINFFVWLCPELIGIHSYLS